MTLGLLAKPLTEKKFRGMIQRGGTSVRGKKMKGNKEK
jgi:hypothetical protein